MQQYLDLLRHIREHGVMNAALCDEVPASLDAIRAYAIRDAVRTIARTAAPALPAAK